MIQGASNDGVHVGPNDWVHPINGINFCIKTRDFPGGQVQVVQLWEQSATGSWGDLPVANIEVDDLLENQPNGLPTALPVADVANKVLENFNAFLVKRFEGHPVVTTKLQQLDDLLMKATVVLGTPPKLSF